MMDMKGSEGLEGQIQAAGMATVDYARGRIYNTQGGEYLVEKYNEYSSKPHDEYIQNEDLPTSQGALYSVSQRVPNVNTNFTGLCSSEVSYPAEQGAYGSLPSEWEQPRMAPEISKDPGGTTGEVLAEKQPGNEASSLNATSSSAQQNPETFKGVVIPCCVYLHNRFALSMKIEDTPTATCDIINQAIISCEELGLNKQPVPQVFALWMRSPLLALQLKPTQKPYEIRRSWRCLVEEYSHGSYNRKQRDEPSLYFQRNVFFPQPIEERFKDQKILELLYEEARNNILEGHYPCEVAHYIMLGGIQARIELGPYNPQVHSTHYFREEQSKYLPAHVRKSSTWTWLPISSKNSAEVRLLEQFKRIPISATIRKLMRKYLEFCWSLPCYGAAFFEGQVEQPVRGLTSLMTHQDIPVLVGINSKGVYVIDDINCTMLLGLKYEELSWEFARPSKEDDPNCLPCLFLQFMVVENGARVSKILQVFSRQASLMDTLIVSFVNYGKAKSGEDTSRGYESYMNSQEESHATSTMASALATFPSLTNKLSKLTLATFDDDGRCIGQMGSWSFSY